MATYTDVTKPTSTGKTGVNKPSGYEVGCRRLLEDGGFRLLEDGSRRLLESAVGIYDPVNPPSTDYDDIEKPTMELYLATEDGCILTTEDGTPIILEQSAIVNSSVSKPSTNYTDVTKPT